MAKKKYTIAAVKQMVEELLHLRPSVDRYSELEKQVKEGLQSLNWNEVECDKGRVFLVVTERVSVTPAVLRAVLRDELGEVAGEQLAGKIIQTKENVPNNVLKAFIDIGEINQEQRDRIFERADKTPVVALHVRPLN